MTLQRVLVAVLLWSVVAGFVLHVINEPPKHQVFVSSNSCPYYTGHGVGGHNPFAIGAEANIRAWFEANSRAAPQDEIVSALAYTAIKGPEMSSP